MQPLMNIDQLAEFLGVPRSWVKDKVAARQIPITWVGRHARFDSADIAGWLDANKESAMTTPPALSVVRRGHPPAGPRPTPPPPPRPARQERVA